MPGKKVFDVVVFEAPDMLAEFAKHRNSIYANIILLKIRSFTAPVQAVFTALDRMYIVGRRMLSI